MERRRRTDRLPSPALLPADPVARARAACEQLAGIGIDSVSAIQVPDDGGAGILCAAAGRPDALFDVACGVARRAVASGRAVESLLTQERTRLRRWRHGAVPLGRVRGGAVVLVASDPRLTERECQAIATWAAPAEGGELAVRGGPCGLLARNLAREFGGDTVVFALFAQTGLLLNLHVRSGALLRAWRVPSDTIWGEVARHGAAFTLGDLPLHPGAELLASVGMRTAGLVGLENGNGIAVGAFGVGSCGDLDVGIAHHLLARAPELGPQLMQLLSSTDVPVATADGSVDIVQLAARVGCRRFAMYARHGEELRLVAAHARDGSRLASPPDELEQQLVCLAADEGIGVASDHAAAVLIGDHTVLYAQDPSRQALECLRLALQDVRRNPFGGEEAEAA